jgi:hypothetical protein
MKDRLEVLLYAETLQETLSPNANPRQGPVGGYQNWMPKAAARIQRAAQTLLHLSSTRFVIPKRTGLRKGGTKKVTVAYSGVALHGQRVGHREVCAATTVPVNGAGKTILGGWATLTSIKTIGGAPLLAFEKWPVQPSIPKASHAAEHRIVVFSTSFSTAPHHTCHYDFHGPGLAHEAGAETAQAANSGQR